MAHLRSSIAREFLAEFLGVVILCVIGNGAIAQQVISRRNDFLSINIAYGVAVTFGVYVAFGVSGGHINPAVTVSQAVIGMFPWRKVPVFLAAQYLGGFLSSVIVFLVYFDGITHIDGGMRQVGGENGTAGIFATYPQPYVSNVTAFFDQVLGTALFIIGVLALTNEKNVSLRVKSLEPLLIGFLVAAIGMSYGVNCGYAINPARDLAPRIFTAIVGYGGEVFYCELPVHVSRNSANNWFFWVPVIGPHVGAIAGALVYKFLIGMHFAHDLELSAHRSAATTEATYEKTPHMIRDKEVGTEDGHLNQQRSPLAQNSSGGSARLLPVLAPQHEMAHRNSMWRQNAARQNPGPTIDFSDIEFLDVRETVPPVAGVRNRTLLLPLMPASKRPAS